MLFLSMMRYRILLVSTALRHGGAERQIVELAIRLRQRGHEVHLVSLLPPEALVNRLSEGNVGYESLGMKRGIPNPLCCWRLRQIVRRWRPDIVHSHMFHANQVCRAVRAITPVPVLVSTIHNTYELPTGVTGVRRAVFREWAYRLGDVLCDATTQISSAGLERYVAIKAVPRRKIHLIPNGVDLAQFRSDPDARAAIRNRLGVGEQFVWLSVGRLEVAKDFLNLLRAFSILAAAGTRLWIVGQGPLRDALETAVYDLQLQGAVSFLGLRHDVPTLMNAADAFVMSSFNEGLPLVLLEASAVGLPIVATDVGGNRDIVPDGLSGMLVPPRDPPALAGAMKTIMSLPPGERCRMAQHGRLHMERHFSIHKVVDQWEYLYAALLDRARSHNIRLHHPLRTSPMEAPLSPGKHKGILKAVDIGVRGLSE